MGGSRVTRPSGLDVSPPDPRSQVADRKRVDRRERREVQLALSRRRAELPSHKHLVTFDDAPVRLRSPAMKSVFVRAFERSIEGRLSNVGLPAWCECPHVAYWRSPMIKSDALDGI